MKLLLENWRKFLKEEELIKESVSDHYDTLSEDDLYDLDIEDLEDLRDFIEDFGADQYSRSRDTKDLYPTIMARIKAIEESEEEEATARIEDIYSGEYAMKLAKAYMGSANQGIELASMIPDTESLAEEFKRLRGLVQEVLGYAEASDTTPWRKWDWNKQPNSIIDSMGALINHLIDLPGENVPDMSELVDERKNIWSMFENIYQAVADLEWYAFYKLHSNSPTARAGSTSSSGVRYTNSYHFIKKWVGEE
jgi:hypothetical protein